MSSFTYSTSFPLNPYFFAKWNERTLIVASVLATLVCTTLLYNFAPWTAPMWSTR